MNYKGFSGDVQYSMEDDCFYGHILYLKHDYISYEAESLMGLYMAFEAAVDDYIDMCAEYGEIDTLP